MNLFEVYPLNGLEIVKGSGSVVWDSVGNSYLDLYGGHAVISIGHSHPHYIARITEQLNKIGFYSNSVIIKGQEELAAKLGRISGKDNFSLFLCSSGAEANENALKLASFHTGRRHIIAFKNSFHGRTSLAVSVTDNPAIQAPINENPHVTFVGLEDTGALEEAFMCHEVCAVIIEGIQGVGGIHVASDSFLQKIRSLCDTHGAVFIADGVQCGYGRSGKFFSHDHSGVVADIYSVAKGMGNGFPVGGILIAPHIKPKYGLLGTTFGGNHLACAASLAVLEVIEQENLLENAAVTGEWLITELKKFPGIKEVRGRGLMIGVEMDEDASALRNTLLKKHRIFTGGANKKSILRLLPSLALSRKDAALFLEVIKETLTTRYVHQ